MKHLIFLAACSFVSGVLLSSCGARGGLVDEEAAVSPEAHEMKQMRRAEFQDREENRAWR